MTNMPMKVIVAGDASSGKTIFCRRMEQPTSDVDATWTRSTREQYPLQSNCAAQDTVRSLTLIDQPRLCSLQRMVYRQAVGLIVVIDAAMLFEMFIETYQALQSSQSFSVACASARGSSQFFSSC